MLDKKEILVTKAKMMVLQSKDSLPLDIGEGVMLNRIGFNESNLTIRSEYTYPVADEIVPEEKGDLIEILLGTVCIGLSNDAQMMEYLENGFTVNYVYFDTKGNLFTELNIDQQIFYEVLKIITDVMSEEEQE